MRPDRIRQVADSIDMAAIQGISPRRDGLGFNMGSFYSTTAEEDMQDDHTGHGCNTVACIAGWTVVVFDGIAALEALHRAPDVRRYDGESSVMGYALNNAIGDRARTLLDLGAEQAAKLFFPRDPDWPSGVDMTQITCAEAVNTLRHLADTGEVVWDLRGSHDGLDFDED